MIAPVTGRTSPPKRVRRNPRQSRSVATVDAILDATTLVARDHSVEGVTMREVLKRAGVSAGSMYQYFPSRDGLLAAWEKRELERMMARLLALAAELSQGTGTLEEAIREVVVAGIDGLGELSRFYRRPLDLVSRVSELVAVGDTIIEGIAGFLAAAEKRDRLRPTDLVLATRIVVFAVGFCSQISLVPGLDERARSAYRAEIGTMVVHYLVRGS
jgi:AcrR family transcriptional regulator